MDKRKKRIMYLVAFLVFFLIEVFIAVFVRDDFIRPYIGDILVVVTLYCFIRVFLPVGVPLLPLYIFFFAVGVEVLQYFKVGEYIGQGNRIIQTIIGSTFDWVDILCYGIGCLLLGGFEIFIWYRRKNADN